MTRSLRSLSCAGNTDSSSVSHRLRRARAVLRNVEKVSGVGHWYLDLRINALEWSDQMFRIHGYEPRAFPPTMARAMAACHPEDRESVSATLSHAVEARKDWSCELRLVRPDGAVRIVHSNGEVYADERGNVLGLLGTFQDVTGERAVQRKLEQQADALRKEVERRSALEEELRRQALTDDLTGVPNRRHFMAQAALELARCARYGRPLSVVGFDLDHFKRVNDTLGHAAGDRVIRTVAGCIGPVLRTGGDLLGRLGGEEFAVLLPETPCDAACELAQRMRAAIENLDIRWEGTRLPISCSFGVSEARAADESIEACLARADEALYEAKSGGRNRVCRR